MRGVIEKVEYNGVHSTNWILPFNDFFIADVFKDLYHVIAANAADFAILRFGRKTVRTAQE